MDQLQAVAATAVAGSLGWGLRGVFGGPRGALVPGALMGGVVALALGGEHAAELAGLAAVGAGALSIGGVMTYGQTLGLMHGPERARTYWWGFLGCFLKGGLWFGLAAVLMALALQDGFREAGPALGVLAAAVLVGLGGRALLNRPFAPPERYPLIYFSHRATTADDPDRPRPESWGALLGGLVALVALGQTVLPGHDLPAVAGIGFLFGGLGFALGEVMQAAGIWRAPLGARVQPWMDWWKVMEMSFGLIAGAGLGLALICYGYPGVHPEIEPAEGLGAGLVALWALLMVAASHGLRAAAGPANLPLAAGLVLVAGAAFAPQVALPVVVGGALLYLMGVNGLATWRARLGRRGVAVTCGVLGLLALGTAWAVSVLPLASALVLVAAAQVLISVWKHIGEAGPLRGNLALHRAALLTHLVFVLMTLGLALLILPR